MTLQKLLTLDLQYLGSNSTPIFQFLFKDSIVSPPSTPFILECHLHLSKSKHQLQKLTQSYFQYLIIFIYLLCVCLFLWMSVSTIYATVIWKKVLNKEDERGQMPHVWAECESERQGRQWLFGGCFDVFPPPIPTCEVGGNDRQTARERRKKRNAVCCNTWSCRRRSGGRHRLCLKCFWSLLTQLPARPQPLSQNSAPFWPACFPLSVAARWIPAAF